MEIQEYDFHVEHIAGVDNHIADTLSRLCFIGEEEVLAYRNEVEYDSEVIPKKQHDIIATCHNSQVGHGGLERTLNKLYAAQHNWDGMRRHTRQFIKQCPVCQKLNPIKVPIKCYPFTTAAYEPMACINIDTIQRILNTEINKSTGVSPAQLLLGGALHLDRQIFVARAPIPGDTDQPRRLSEWADAMIARQAQLINGTLTNTIWPPPHPVHTLSTRSDPMF